MDAGKTTITEHLLFLSGETRKMGSVDTGSAVTDSLDIEQKRGISVRSTAVTLTWKNQIINILDTPGHVDFSAEVERVLRVLDGAIIVLSAVEGVQSHTVSLVEILKELQIPFVFFINKIDRDGADYEGVLQAIRDDFDLNLLPINCPVNEASSKANIISFWQDTHPFPTLFESISESIIELDDDLMTQYLNGHSISNENLWKSGLQDTHNQNRVAVLTGIAKNGIGIEALLDAIIDYLPNIEQHNEWPFSALVYKVEQHKLHGRLAHIRVFDGQIKSKDTLFFQRNQEERTIGVTKKVKLNKLQDVDKLQAGELGIITGIPDIYAGDILGDIGRIPPPKVLQNAVMTVQVVPENKNDYHDLSKALQILDSEDPSLDFQWIRDTQEFHLKIIGPMQTEILENQLQERFSIKTRFDNPMVIYKERPLQTAEGYVRYWMPKPCWAIMTFLIEPLPLGSGVIYESKVRTSDVHQKYQNEVERTIPRALKQGIKGWEVTDLKITLIQGEDHIMHSRPGDFVLATPMGILRGLQNSGTEFLEPVLDFTVKAPEDLLGKIASDLTRMRASFANPSFENGMVTLSGVVPAATSLDYSIKLSSLTSGKGRIIFKFKGYEPCLDHQGVVRAYKGVSPLDESKWILHQRGAYRAEDRER